MYTPSQRLMRWKLLLDAGDADQHDGGLVIPGPKSSQSVMPILSIAGHLIVSTVPVVERSLFGRGRPAALRPPHLTAVERLAAAVGYTTI